MKTTILKITAGALAAVLVLTLSTGQAQARRAKLVDHPNKLEFPARSIDIPASAEYRHELAGGNVAYIVPDNSLPLVKISVLSRAGSYLLSCEDAGLSGLTGTMLRDGGTRELSPEELDERLDFLATNISTGIGATSSSASLDTLTVNLDESLDLLFDILSEPRFDAERLAINQAKVIERFKQRNDDTRSIGPRVWSGLIYGDGFFLNNRATEAQVNAITVERMQALASRVFANGHLVISVSGDVDPESMRDKLNAELARLPAGAELPAIPDRFESAAPGLYGVNKDDVNQTRVRIGHPGPRRGHPDEYAIDVMNEILGGGGFTSRIVKRVRSDEGLAYSAGSSFNLGRWYPGVFVALFQSKNESVSQAVGIVLEEIDKIRTQPVSEQELSTAQESVIAVLNELFTNASRRASRFASDEINGEDKDIWKNLEANVRKVGREDVQRVAHQWLQPDQLRILLTGRLDEARAGDGEHGSIEEVAGMPLKQLPLKDPLTLETLPLE